MKIREYGTPREYQAGQVVRLRPGSGLYSFSSTGVIREVRGDKLLLAMKGATFWIRRSDIGSRP
jgi:hypothetical protein